MLLNEIQNCYRLDLAFGEIEEIPAAMITHSLFDVRTAFRKQSETLSGELFTDSAEDEALEAVSAGAVLFTDKAIYASTRTALTECLSFAGRNRQRSAQRVGRVGGRPVCSQFFSSKGRAKRRARGR